MSYSQGQLKYFADFIEGELGIVYGPNNYYQLEKRLSDICKSLSLKSENELWTQVNERGIKGHVRQLLLDTATNNETSFFRDPNLFEVIKKYMIPDWRKENPQNRVARVWSAASSFGQEPYSLTILFNEMMEQDRALPRFEILATDISEVALAKAKKANYSQLEVQRGLSAQRLIKYFSKKDDDYWHLNAEYRTQVQFQKLNLLDISLLPGKFDLVLCRNVLIYQNNERKKAIIKNITDKISDRGYLLLGSAESLIGLSNDFDQYLKDGAVYYQKKKNKE